ncbi:ABC transporter permease [Natrinema gelatinilyticum]|uniref:ABC transporter permease n=1 Tax=Natrinema gelatinilyticum TaxID=2961571 RepID=UPI0020C4472C|nr:ABC transporter permease [Natrinema gelatinilyticum]
MGADEDATDSTAVDTIGERELDRTGLSSNRSPLPAPSIRTAGFLVSAGVVAVVAGYDLFVRASGGPLAFGWYPDPIDWLFLLSFQVLGWYVAVPLVATPRRTLRRLWELRANPTVLASVVYLCIFVLVGTIGAWLVGTPHSDLTQSMQPPAFLGVPEFVPGQCVGPVEDGTCHGTLRHPLGTSAHGKDMVAVVAVGARVSLQVAVIVAAIVAPLAVAVGATAGFVGGIVDDALVSYIEIQRSIPPLVAYVVLVYLFGPSLHLFVLVFGLLGWGGVAQIVRSEVLQCKQEQFVRAARCLGGGPLYVLRRHVLPNIRESVAVATTQQIPAVLLAEAAVAFLRLNDGATPSWGEAILVGFGSQYKFSDAWWLTTIPVAFLAATIVSIAVIGDWLGDDRSHRSVR